MSRDEQFVARAVLEEDRFTRIVGKGGAGLLRVRNLHKNRMVDDPGMSIDEQLDSSETAAVVPAAGIGTGGDGREDNRDEQDTTFQPLLPPLRRDDHVAHGILPNAIRLECSYNVKEILAKEQKEEPIRPASL